MSSSKNLSARERARLAAEQAAARKRDQRILISVVAAFVVLVVAGGILFQGWRSSRSPSAAPSASSSAAPVTITNGKPIPLGSADAPVTITLYEDFHCPHCADFEEEFGPTITQAQESGAARVELYPMSFIDEGLDNSGQRDGLRRRSQASVRRTISGCSPTTRCSGVIPS